MTWPLVLAGLGLAAMIALLTRLCWAPPLTLIADEPDPMPLPAPTPRRTYTLDELLGDDPESPFDVIGWP